MAIDIRSGHERPLPAGRPDLASALKDVVARRGEDLARKALAAEGELDTTEAERLRRLADLAELMERVRPKPAKSRMPLLLALGLAAVLVLVATLLRIDQTEVAAELSVSELSLRLAEGREITPSLALASLGIAGAKAVELPQSLEPGLRAAASRAGAALRLDSGAVAAKRGNIDLSPLVLPSGSRIAVSLEPRPGRYHLTLSDAPGQFDASLRGPLHFTVTGEPPQTVEFAVPKPVWIRADKSPVSFDLALSGVSGSSLAAPIEIDGLSLQHIDAPRPGGRASVQALSTIRSGSLYWLALDGKERKLLPHELLSFDKLRGQISTLRLEPDQIVLRLQAKVSGLAVGSGENRRSLMPTWLEYLRERHGLSLFWGSALYLFGLMAGVWRWWREPS